MLKFKVLTAFKNWLNVTNRSENQFHKKSIQYFAFLRDKLKHERAKHCAPNAPFLPLKIVSFVITFSLPVNQQEHSFWASFAAMIDQTLFFFASYLNSTVRFWWMAELRSKFHVHLLPSHQFLYLLEFSSTII